MGDDISQLVVSLSNEPSFFDIEVRLLRRLDMDSHSLRLGQVKSLRRIVRRWSPDIVHGWLYYGNLATVVTSRLAPVTVWSIHNTLLPQRQSKFLATAANWVCSKLSGHVPDRIVYVSDQARDDHEAMGYEKSKSVVINNGVNLDYFTFRPEHRDRLRSFLGLEQDEKLVGCVARFDAQKDHATLAAAFAQVAADRKARLVLIGRGCTARNGDLVRILKQAGVLDLTILLGERDDVHELLSGIDVIVISSAFGEAAPLIAIEAAAAVRPLVATNVGHVAPFVLDSSHLVEPGDARAMGLAISAAMDMELDPKLPELLAARREKLCKYRGEDMVQNYRAFYSSLVQ
jgi:glycosyltransferase involved in cell wall biosynthesis